MMYLLPLPVDILHTLALNYIVSTPMHIISTCQTRLMYLTKYTSLRSKVAQGFIAICPYKRLLASACYGFTFISRIAC